MSLLSHDDCRSSNNDDHISILLYRRAVRRWHPCAVRKRLLVVMTLLNVSHISHRDMSIWRWPSWLISGQYDYRPDCKKGWPSAMPMCISCEAHTCTSANPNCNLSPIIMSHNLWQKSVQLWLKPRTISKCYRLSKQELQGVVGYCCVTALQAMTLLPN